MQKNTLSYLPAISSAMLDMNERDNIARHTFQRRALPAIDLELVGRFAANNRARTVYRVMTDGQEVGTAAQWDDRPTAPWSLTVPGYCANLSRDSRATVLATVARILVTGQLWES